jgi:hypothetical protein
LPSSRARTSVGESTGFHEVAQRATGQQQGKGVSYPKTPRRPFQRRTSPETHRITVQDRMSHLGWTARGSNRPGVPRKDRRVSAARFPAPLLARAPRLGNEWRVDPLSNTQSSIEKMPRWIYEAGCIAPGSAALARPASFASRVTVYSESRIQSRGRRRTQRRGRRIQSRGRGCVRTCRRVIGLAAGSAGACAAGSFRRRVARRRRSRLTRREESGLPLPCSSASL